MLKRIASKLTNKPIVFITGDKGKLGSLISKDLENDFIISGYDLQHSKQENLDNYPLLLKKMRGAKFVIHLAAIPHPNPKLTFDDYFKVNVIGTYNVLRAAKENNIKRLIYLSSTAYYGCNTEGKVNPLYFPIDELHPPASRKGITDGKLSEYGQSKVICEELCAYYGSNRFFEVVVFRSGPANEVESQYPEGFNWKTNNSYQKTSFWAINPPHNLVKIVRKAIETKEHYYYEPFNVMSSITPDIIDIEKFVKDEYPKTEIRKMNLKSNASLFDTKKVKNIFGITPNLKQ